MEYIKYRLKLLEPVRIADDSSAKQGQTMTRSFIPGSTIRGYVINKLAEEPYFSEIKRELFSDRVRFHNAYLTVGEADKENVLLPSPKGFNEDKSEIDGVKPIQNMVVDGDFDEAKKRAKLGTNVYIEMPDRDNTDPSTEGTIHFYSPKLMSDTKIKLGAGDDQDVFRSTSIRAGYVFTGYIALDNEGLTVTGGPDSPDGSAVTLADVLKEAMGDQMTLGNARTSGLGKCHVKLCGESEEMPYASYMIQGDVAEIIPEGDEWKDCYMMLLSDTVMRDAKGEYCGLDIPTLKELLGVKELEINICSTSVGDVRGFNRHYGGAIPSMPVYEKGSVFCFRYKGSLSKEHLDDVHRRGIGVRRNEGFGQVLFIRNYEAVHNKIKGIEKFFLDDAVEVNSMIPEKHAEDAAVILQVAKSYYRKQIEKAVVRYIVGKRSRPEATSSQLGNILSIAVKNRFSPEVGWRGIDAYLSQKTKKDQDLRVHSTNKKRLGAALQKAIKRIETVPLHELLGDEFLHPKRIVMGIRAGDLLSDIDEQRVRLELLIRLIRYDFKKEVTE